MARARRNLDQRRRGHRFSREYLEGRKSAFGAIGQISPDYLCMDGTIPVTKLPDVLEQIYAIGDRYGFEIANIFHAGDGNMHPLICTTPPARRARPGRGRAALKSCAFASRPGAASPVSTGSDREARSHAADVLARRPRADEGAQARL